MSLEDTNLFVYANVEASKYADAYEEGFNKFKKNRQSIRDIRRYGIRHYKNKMQDEPNVETEKYISSKKKMDKLYSKLYKLKEQQRKISFSNNIYWELWDFYLTKIDHLLKKEEMELNFDNYINCQNTPIKKITKTKKQKFENEVCSICLEKHNYKNLVQLNCRHVIGKICCQEMINSNLEMWCPLCRNNCENYKLLRLKNKN